MLAPDCQVVGLTGSFGSGCTTAARLLEQRMAFRRVGLSDLIKQKWSSSNSGDPDRKALQQLGDEMRRQQGRAVLAETTLAQLHDDGELISRLVVDGLRNLGEIQYLRDYFGYRFTLLAVMADQEVRWERIGDVYQEAGLSQVEFLDDDQRDMNEESPSGQEVQLCIDLADMVIVNDERVTIGEYRNKVEAYASLALGLRKTEASRDEVFMHQAFSARHSSRCIKRHVGAIVVDARGWVVATGYNENPTGTLPCVDEPLYREHESGPCLRDIYRNDHFRTLAESGARCPVCGDPIDLIVGPPWYCRATCASAGVRTNLERYYVIERAMSVCTAIHAEVAALLAAGERARGGTLYTTTFPCMQCAEKIIHCGIQRVVFTEAYADTMGEKRFELGHVAIEKFEGVRSAAFERIYGRPENPN